MKRISIIIPAYNEEKNIVRVIADVLEKLEGISSRYDIELVVVDDGSKDATPRLVMDLAKKDPRIKYIQFTRNFGKETALTAGIMSASGDAVVMIDADGQHPPELIADFITTWEAGSKVVVGVRNSHRGESPVKRIGSYFFYKLMSATSETEMVPYSTDFRLLDRDVVESFKLLEERSRITRGLIDWLGYDTVYVKYSSNQRASGNPGYSFIKLIRLALSSFATHSLFPLKLVGYLGACTTVLSFLFGCFVILVHFIIRTSWGLSLSGADMLSILIVFLISLVLCCLGFMALYIGNIQTQSLRRPHFVIRRKVNFVELP